MAAIVGPTKIWPVEGARNLELCLESALMYCQFSMASTSYDTISKTAAAAADTGCIRGGRRKGAASRRNQFGAAARARNEFIKFERVTNNLEYLTHIHLEYYRHILFYRHILYYISFVCNYGLRCVVHAYATRVVL